MAIEKIIIPDFGDVQQITVVELFVGPGDTVEEETSIIALESEKAVMDIPSPFAGVIKELFIKEDDVVGSGDLIATIETAEAGTNPADISARDIGREDGEETAPLVEEKIVQAGQESPPAQISHATPSVRRFAREQGVELADIVGSGPHGRILKSDIISIAATAEIGNTQQTKVQAQPLEDFSKFGQVEEILLGRIKKISGPHLLRSWTTIPHVTHFDEADITELEGFRKKLNSDQAVGKNRLSLLVFIVKAVTATLRQFPFFNSSLKPDADSLILKKYYHIGIAVDTADGLVVPVIKDADKKGFEEINETLMELSGKARSGKLAISDLQGASFTISSLGGIGGTGFTPIVNSPQVAILGLSRSFMKPVWDGQQFVPRLTLPFSVSYDHRAIDGAEAARFCKNLAMNIEDLKRTLL